MVTVMFIHVNTVDLDLYKSVGNPQVFNFESHDLASFKWFGDFDWLISSQVLAS